MTSIKELQVASTPSFKKEACLKCGRCVNLPDGGRRRIDPSGRVGVYLKQISDCSVKNSVKDLSISEAERLLSTEEKQSS